ncbi:MAG: 5,10-methylenetetrahydromethanopterin reductase [Candidatus Bathyarchaeia archaeon]
MKIGIELVPDLPCDEICRLAIRAENGGIEDIWVSDHYFNRDVFITLGQLASNTKRVLLGAGVVNPYSRNTCVIASSVATLDEISNGRVLLGLGAGDITVLGTIGERPVKPLSALSESMSTIRKLLMGESVSSRGKHVKVKSVKLRMKTSHSVPLYVGAQGPRMLQLAGSLADGVLINASHPKDITLARTQINTGLKEQSRTQEKLDIAALTVFSTHKNTEEARKAARQPLAVLVSGASLETLERHSIDLAPILKAKRYLRKGRFGKAASQINDEIIESFSISGTPDECIQKINRLKKQGLKHIVIGTPLGPDREWAVNAITKRILPEFQ